MIILLNGNKYPIKGNVIRWGTHINIVDSGTLDERKLRNNLTNNDEAPLDDGQGWLCLVWLSGLNVPLVSFIIPRIVCFLSRSLLFLIPTLFWPDERENKWNLEQKTKRTSSLTLLLRLLHTHNLETHTDKQYLAFPALYFFYLLMNTLHLWICIIYTLTNWSFGYIYYILTTHTLKVFLVRLLAEKSRKVPALYIVQSKRDLSKATSRVQWEEVFISATKD